MKSTSMWTSKISPRAPMPRSTLLVTSRAKSRAPPLRYELSHSRNKPDNLPLKTAAMRLEKTKKPDSVQQVIVKKRLSMIVFLALSLTPFLFAQESTQPTRESASIAGKWQLTRQGVLGTKHGSLQIQQ